MQEIENQSKYEIMQSNREPFGKIDRDDKEKKKKNPNKMMQNVSSNWKMNVSNKYGIILF